MAKITQGCHEALAGLMAVEHSLCASSVLCVLCKMSAAIYIQCTGDETEPREGRGFQKDTQLVSWEPGVSPSYLIPELRFRQHSLAGFGNPGRKPKSVARTRTEGWD